MLIFSCEVVAWEGCDDCDEFICNIHGIHVHECPCPPIDDWVEAGYDPYLTPVSQELDEWVRNNELDE